MLIRDLVKEALENAADNGHTFDGWTSEQIADDMIEFNSALEDCSADELVPLIEELRS